MLEVALAVAALSLFVAALVILGSNRTLGNALLLLSSAVALPLVLTETRLRSGRVLFVLLAIVAAFYASSFVGNDQGGRILQIALLGVAVVVMQWPDRLHLAAPYERSKQADAALRRAAVWLRDAPGDQQPALELLEGLAPGTFPIAGTEWAVAATLFHVALYRRIHGELEDATPIASDVGAARSFWRAALEREVVGPRYRPDPWDEGVALRCYLEEFRAAIPEATTDPDVRPDGNSARVGQEDWATRAAGTIEQLRSIPLVAPAARKARDDLSTLMGAELAIYRGDDSDEAELGCGPRLSGRRRRWRRWTRRSTAGVPLLGDPAPFANLSAMRTSVRCATNPRTIPAISW